MMPITSLRRSSILAEYRCGGVAAMGSHWFVVFLVVFIVSICGMGWIKARVMAAIRTMSKWLALLLQHPQVALTTLWVKFWKTWKAPVVVWTTFYAFARTPSFTGFWLSKVLFCCANAVLCAEVCIVEEIHGAKGSRRAFGQRATVMILAIVFFSFLSLIECGMVRNSENGEVATWHNIWTASLFWKHSLESKSPAADEPFVDPPLIASDAEQLPHIDLTKRALIKGGAGDAYFCRPGGGGITEIHIMLGLIDLGIPTSLGGWKLHYESPRLNQWFRYIEIDDHDVCNDRTLAFKFNRANSIYEQTDSRMEPNTKYRGWARFQVPGFLYKELGTKEAQLTIEFSDNQGKKYTIIYIGDGETNSKPFYYPGVPSPLIEPDPGIADVRWCVPEPIERIPWGFTAGYCNYGPSKAQKFDSFVSERSVVAGAIRSRTFQEEQQNKFIAAAKHALETDPRPTDLAAGHNMHGNIFARPGDVPLIRKGRKVLVLRGYAHWDDSIGNHELDSCKWLEPPTLPPRAGKAEKQVWQDCN
jgi:hypothetical protein